MVTDFLSSIGLDDCNSLIGSMNISAAKLEKADQDWLEETFDCDYGDNEWKKMIREIQQMRKRCLLETVLYGFGSNNFGQLAHEKITVATAPIKIEIPDFFSLDQKKIDINSVQTEKQIFVEDIVCSGRMSGIISSAGDLWMCGNMK